MLEHADRRPLLTSMPAHSPYSPRFQLVYACGAAQGLPAIDESAAAMQALLRAISEAADSSQQGNLAQDKNAVWALKGGRQARLDDSHPLTCIWLVVTEPLIISGCPSFICAGLLGHFAACDCCRGRLWKRLRLSWWTSWPGPWSPTRPMRCAGSRVPHSN